MQDNIKVTQRLVINAGVRYSYYRDPTEWLLAASNNFDPATYDSATAGTISAKGYICLAASCPGGGATPNPNYDPLDGIIMLFTFSLMRNIRMSERMRLQLRSEAYNAFNDTNFNGANTKINSTNFGAITNNGDPRNMQIAAQFYF